jgi:hypothetical protein
MDESNPESDPIHQMSTIQIIERLNRLGLEKSLRDAERDMVERAERQPEKDNFSIIVLMIAVLTVCTAAIFFALGAYAARTHVPEKHCSGENGER